MQSEKVSRRTKIESLVKEEEGVRDVSDCRESKQVLPKCQPIISIH